MTSTTSRTSETVGRAALGGIAICIPLARAMHSPASGQTSHFGAASVQMRAPNSIDRLIEVAGGLAGNTSRALSHNHFCPAPDRGSPV